MNFVNRYFKKFCVLFYRYQNQNRNENQLHKSLIIDGTLQTVLAPSIAITLRFANHQDLDRTATITKIFVCVVLLAVVDANDEFIMVDVSVNGQVSDGGVLGNAEFGNALSKKGWTCYNLPICQQ